MRRFRGGGGGGWLATPVVLVAVVAAGLWAVGSAGASEPERYPAIQGLLDSSGASSPEEFIAALPLEHRQRFVLYFDSTSPAADHVSDEWPRVITIGWDASLVYAWNSDPDAPSEFYDTVEFLRQDRAGWTAGIIDFSDGSPSISEPASCQSCHSYTNKPMWDEWVHWSGTEYIEPDIRTVDELKAVVEAVKNSDDERLGLLDFSVSRQGKVARVNKPLGGGPSVMPLVEETGALLSWRHAEVLHGILGERHGTEFTDWQRRSMCSVHPMAADTDFLLVEFPQEVHNLAVSAENPTARELHYAGLSYQYQPGADIASAVLLLMAADVHRTTPVVQALYDATPNTALVHSHLPEHYGPASTHYPAGTATAADELEAAMRLHFGPGSRAQVQARNQQNNRVPFGGPISGQFRLGHTAVMVPLICDALTFDARTANVPAGHDGESAFTFDLSFDREPRLGYRNVRDSLFSTAGGRITRAKRAAPGSNTAWRITVQPEGPHAVTIDYSPPASCTDPAAVCTAQGEWQDNALAIAVPYENPSPAPLTATAAGLPASHDGTTPFTFTLTFSRAPALSYKTLRDTAFTTANARIAQARRAVRGSNIKWNITVQPQSTETITLTLPTTADCDSTTPICTPDNTPLTTRIDITIPHTG